MPLVVVLSSYVAGSRVGGGIAPYVLAPHKIDAVHIPTTLYGRHPGWGPPGGGPVPDDVFAGMIDGIAGNGLLARADVILTGYFVSPEQVAAAAKAIDRARSETAERITGSLQVVVDPIIGDDRGAYVNHAVEQALKHELLPRADILTPNRWELERLSGTDVKSAADIRMAIKALPIKPLTNIVTTSVRHGGLIGAATFTPSEQTIAYAGTEPIEASLPNGTGDLFALVLIAATISGRTLPEAVCSATGVTHTVLKNAVRWEAEELPLAASFQDIKAFAGQYVFTEID